MYIQMKRQGWVLVFLGVIACGSETDAPGGDVDSNPMDPGPFGGMTTGGTAAPNPTDPNAPTGEMNQVIDPNMPVDMMAGTGGMGGMAGTGGMEIVEPAAASMPCMTRGQDLLLIGDSYVSYLSPLQPPLEAEAKAAGQLNAGETYANRAVAGTDIAQIVTQWNAGKADNPKYIVMTGGGNDVLLNAQHCLNDGATNDPSCIAVVDGVLGEFQKMIVDMKANGVSGLTYFFYPHVPAGGAEILDYTLPLINDMCDGAKDATFDCAVVDTVPSFMGRPELILFDGIHPTVGGQEVIADLIWTAMEDHCFGHFSGCCI